MNQLRYPTDICISPNGDELYIANSSNGNVIVLNALDGSHLRTYDSFTQTSCVCISHDGEFLFVGDRIKNHVQVLNAHDGSIIRTIEKLHEPISLCVSQNGELYVCCKSSVIRVFSNGELNRSFVMDDDSYIHGICLSPNGDELYVVDYSNNSVKVLRSTDGSLVRTYSGQFNSPKGVCISPSGETLYVTESTRIHVLKTDGTYVRFMGRTIGGQPRVGNTPKGVDNPRGICISSDGNELYVADSGNARVKVYRADE